MKVVLVRHAMPQLEADVRPEDWLLSPVGGAAATSLRALLPVEATWRSSPEPKARDTLRLAAPTARIEQDPDFGEVRRDEPFAGDFRARRAAWIVGDLDDRHRGWESPQQVADRFAGALARAVVGADPELPVVIATHGMAMTAWLVRGVGVLPPQRAVQFWSELACPDVVTVAKGRLTLGS
ncbi:histidine phosphatase family protein [Calidifontibacter terrae]